MNNSGYLTTWGPAQGKYGGRNGILNAEDASKPWWTYSAKPPPYKIVQLGFHLVARYCREVIEFTGKQPVFLNTREVDIVLFGTEYLAGELCF